MAMTQRERMIGIVTGAAVAIFAFDRYALSPYLAARDTVRKEATLVTDQNTEAQKTFAKQKRLKPEWDAMVSGGLKSDAGDAEQQLYEAVRDWAREARLTVLTSDRQRIAQKDRTQIVRLRVTGTGTTAQFAEMLWNIETSALPVKVEEFSLTSRSQGNDDLAVTMAVSTIWIRPPSPDDLKAKPGLAPRRPAGGEDL